MLTKTQMLDGINKLAKYLGSHDGKPTKTWKKVEVADMHRESKLNFEMIANLVEGKVLERKPSGDGNKKLYRWAFTGTPNQAIEIALMDRSHKHRSKKTSVGHAANSVIVNQHYNEQPAIPLPETTEEWQTLVGFKSTETHLTITIDKRVQGKSLDYIIALFEKF